VIVNVASGFSWIVTGLVSDLGLQCFVIARAQYILSQMYHEKTKHIDVKFYFFREVDT
jgi:hypothetical protein